jgi:hypothetical protein
MTDWIYTDHARFNIFKARTVVGGYFMKLLMDKTKE